MITVKPKKWYQWLSLKFWVNKRQIEKLANSTDFKNKVRSEIDHQFIYGNPKYND
jgi:hypothetical protein